MLRRFWQHHLLPFPKYQLGIIGISNNHLLEDGGREGSLDLASQETGVDTHLMDTKGIAKLFRLVFLLRQG
jgi:hypothetical protein